MWPDDSGSGANEVNIEPTPDLACTGGVVEPAFLARVVAIEGPRNFAGEDIYDLTLRPNASGPEPRSDRGVPLSKLDFTVPITAIGGSESASVHEGDCVAVIVGKGLWACGPAADCVGLHVSRIRVLGLNGGDTFSATPCSGTKGFPAFAARVVNMKDPGDAAGVDIYEMALRPDLDAEPFDSEGGPLGIHDIEVSASNLPKSSVPEVGDCVEVVIHNGRWACGKTATCDGLHIGSLEILDTAGRAKRSTSAPR
jgi:hypothetical protein